MTIESDSEIIERINSLMSNQVTIKSWPDYPEYHNPSMDGHDASQDIPLGSKEAHCLFFFYFRIDKDGKLRVTHYYFDNGATPINDLERCISIVGQYARDKKWDGTNGREPVMQKHANFKNIKFDRISYCVIFVDDLHWDFLLDRLGKPIVPFHKNKDGKKPEANYSFYGAKVHKIKMPTAVGTDERHALSMLNLLHDAKGDGLKVEQLFAFDLVMRVTFANADEYDSSGKPVPSANPSRLTVIFDPGGTNLGPPIPPPD